MSIFDSAMRAARRYRLNDVRLVRKAISLVPPLDVWLHDEWNRRQHLVPAAALQQEFEKALRYLTRRHGQAELGDYLEFGVFRGESLLCMQRALDATGLRTIRLFGFDSFEGLPDSSDPDDAAMRQRGGVSWKARSFDSRLNLTRRALAEGGADMDRTTLVKGWYEDTLTSERRNELGLTQAAVVMMDCVLYSSTRQALAFCEPLIREETVFVFDDWDAGSVASLNLGEPAAFQEFLAEHPDLAATEIGGYVHEEQGLSSRARIFAVSRGTPASVA